MVTELLNSADVSVDTKQEISEEVLLEYTGLWWECRLSSAEFCLSPGVSSVTDCQELSVVPFKSIPYPQLLI